MRYRAAPADALLIVPLDLLTAVYHRPSGQTHLLTEPAIEILAALAFPQSVDELETRLAASFDLGEAPRAGLAARLEELVGCGLVAPL